MKYQYQYICYIVLVALSIQSVVAATSRQIGAYISTNETQYYGDYGKINKYFNDLTDYRAGVGSGVGLGVEGKLYFTRNIFTSANIGYRTTNFSLFATEPITLIYADGPRSAEIDHTLGFNLSVINMRAMFGYHLWKGFFVATGPSLDLYLSQEIDYSMDLESDGDRAVFQNTLTNELDANTHGIPAQNQYEVAWSFAAGYSLSANKQKSLYITPQIVYNLGLTNISDNFSSSLNVIEYSLGFAYELQSTVLPALNADVRMAYVNPKTNNDANNDTSIVVERSTTRKHFPLLNYIFFDKESEEIPDRYQKITAEKAKYFYESDIHAKDAMDVYYQILNIVGRRMTGNRGTKITLSKRSITAEELADSSFIHRAEVIRNYLVLVWDLDATRIDIAFDTAITKKRDFLPEHIEILSEDKGLFYPVVQEVVAYDLKSEALAFDIQIEDSTFKNWTFSAQYGNDTISQIYGKTAISHNVESSIKAYKATDFFDNNKMLSYQLKVDGGNQYKDMQLSNSTYLNVSVDETVTDDFYMLWLNQTSFRIRDMLHFHWPTIRKVISNDYSYTVQAYTDKDLNTLIAERVAISRIEKINEIVGFDLQNIITTNDAFISKQLYDETYPEGIIYNRCIEIIIKH